MTDTCKHCSKEIEHETFGSSEIDRLFKGLFNGLCKECENKEIEKCENEEALQRQREKAFRIEKKKTETIPKRYRDTRTNHPDFNNDLHVEVSAWSPTIAKPWIGVIGQTGACKTRCLAQRLEKFIEDGKQCNFINAAEFGNLALRQYSDQGGAACLVQLESLIYADAVLFDDFGKLKPTAIKEQELFRLLEARMAAGRPLLWTANLNIEESTAGFSKEYRDPIVGRLLDASIIVEVDVH